METLFQWITDYGYFAIFVLLLLGLVGLPVPDEVLLTFVGFLAFKGILNLSPTYLVAFCGSISGISISYGVGRFLGIRLIRKYGQRVYITTHKMDRVHTWFESYGKWTLLFGYFIPGFRHATAMVAGASKLRYPVFAPFAYCGGLFWSSLYVSIGYTLGQEWEQVSRIIQNYIWVIALSAAAILFITLYFRRKYPRVNDF